MSEENKDILSKIEVISHEWELQKDGTYKRSCRICTDVVFQDSFVDDSDFMPNISGLSENMSGSAMNPVYDFNTKDDEFNNRVSVAVRNPALDPTEVDAIIKAETESISQQFESARDAVQEELDKMKSEGTEAPSSSSSDSATS